MYYTTIRKILNNNPCDPIKVIRLAGSIDYNLPIAFKHIYDRTDLQDAIWCICTLDYDAEIQQFALRCARSVEHLDETDTAKKCNDTLEKYLKGEATREDLNKATRAATTRAAIAVTWATWAASVALNAAAGAAWAAAWATQATTASATVAIRTARDVAAISKDTKLLKQIEQDFLTTFCME